MGVRVKGNDKLHVEVHFVFDVTDRNLVGVDELNSIVNKLCEEYDGTMKLVDFEIRLSTEKSGAHFEESVGVGDAGKNLQEDIDEMTEDEDGNDSKMEEDLKENKEPTIANTSTTGQPMSNASLNVDVNTEKVEQLPNVNQDSIKGQASPSEPTEKRMNKATEAVNNSITRRLVGCRSEQARNDIIEFKMYIALPLANLTTSGQDECQNETVKQMVSEWKLVISRQFKVDSDNVDLKREFKQDILNGLQYTRDNTFDIFIR
ncbi:hypothetical protein FGIG_12101 [Fasciola gigantica]|uniref:Uncharacterized protein n=1 Tax=Fasciola gigantica TaxID=46835 RepID=A0A504YYV7_FASGI|nr:hypothetical protein FGIG_12101 [Fasciola gigantica]